MTKGYSLEQDLRSLINNPKYSDIEILCEDERKLYGCRAILAARSEMFDGLLYNGMRESHQNQISFPTINSSIMEMILEYIYTGSIKENSLTKDNIVEVFYAADYFILPDLQEFITITVRNILENNHPENYSPELLSKFLDTIPLSEDNVLLNLFVDAVASTPLNSIEFGRLSIAAFRYLLSRTCGKERSEYELFRYSAILVAKQISDDSYKALMERLPTLEQIGNTILIDVEHNDPIAHHQEIANELAPLIEFIDFERIKSHVLADIIEPLDIIPSEIILRIYRHKALTTDLNLIQEMPQPMFDHVWDESACGANLVIEENGKVVCANNDCSSYKSVKAKMRLDNRSVFEWDIIIETNCNHAYIGVCASNNFNYEAFAGYQSTGWVLNSRGNCCTSGIWLNSYCPRFGDGAKITVHLDMYRRTCSFTVNGTRYPELPEWNNLPSVLYPVVSLKYPGRFRIQPHQDI
jgi:hypothetical protein